ncbi:MAG: MotA/TolQ/ExbB proton channel family protein [Xanthomonadales bacterium]|nr:MotA/TolQ/ExbB proton channel family protein [Xanthomonadales bacterium]NIN60673.1 MotA/TolQ/ExbB proton channel family protein [Xanthomonadales bacterium]NIN75534.1 MotA/TolQ/ExbB proton channel family protein [Xanthomonadales bacterium]NIO15294.1 MotA/TolQ/ExbB proton channel family protein [Xanthomonadales bacterium]NIP13066.1 MotA/TolQ/ExbB proton channel family protein [Xanthomonadales bacterium]
MLEIILAGGWLMAPILLCSTLAVAIIIERFWSLRRRSVVPDGVGEMVIEWAARQELDRAHIERLRRQSALGTVLAAALVNRHRPRELIKEAVEDTGRHVVHELERFLNTLGTIAGIAPLLGLLGTVIGMIRVFSAIMIHGVGNPSELAGGISEALITTAAGLTVAIPSYFFYRYFRGMVAEYVISMEEQAINLIEAIEQRNVVRGTSGRGGS